MKSVLLPEQIENSYYYKNSKMTVMTYLVTGKCIGEQILCK